MQTFLPYPDFYHTAASLDYRRLGKQRVEAFQILNVLLGRGRILKNGQMAWQNHPAVKMWRGYEAALAQYGQVICIEWKRRGYKDSLMDRFNTDDSVRYPDWLGDIELHRSHQSNLIRKLPEFYHFKFPNVPPNLPYKWPV